MKRILLSVAALILACSAMARAGNPKADQISVSQAQIVRAQDQSEPKPITDTFIGTITKDGDIFILRDATTKASYQLDDQQTASKFAGKKVKVTGVLDASNNTISVQSIEDANV